MFSYEELWKQEEQAKAQRNEALFHWELKNERMTAQIGEDWESLLSNPQSWNPKRFNRILRQRFIACCLILDLNWKDYKFLTIQEISEMSGLSRQKVRALVDILLDGHYLKQVKSGFQKVRKAYKAN